MDAPEKIYLIRNFTTSTSLNTTNDYRGKYLQEWYKTREKDADVEYIRADVFIKQTCAFLKARIEHDSIDYPMATEHLIDDYIKYMNENKTMDDKDLIFVKNAILHKQCYNCALHKKCMQDDPYFEPIGTCSKWTEE